MAHRLKGRGPSVVWPRRERAAQRLVASMPTTSVSTHSPQTRLPVPLMWVVHGSPAPMRYHQSTPCNWLHSHHEVLNESPSPPVCQPDGPKLGLAKCDLNPPHPFRRPTMSRLAEGAR